MNRTGGSMAHIAGTVRPKEFHYTRIMDNGKRSPKFRCRSRGEGQALYAAWSEEQAIEAARGSAEKRTVRYHIEEHWKAVKAGLSDNTIALRESTRSVHILTDAQFMASDFYKLTSADVQAFLGRIIGSEATKRRAYTYLRWAFESLVEERVLPANPIFVAKAKVPKQKKSKVVSFKPEHEIKLLKFVQSDLWWNALCLLGFDGGLRMSEVLAMRVDKVNFEASEVSIHRAVVTITGPAVCKDTTKTDSSYRTIRLASATMHALRALRTHGKPVSDYFFSRDGNPMSRYVFDNAWCKLLEAAEVPHHSFHQVRHTCATRLLREGHFITSVSKRLGHAKPSITLDLYSDALPQDQVTLANAFDAYVVGNIAAEARTEKAA